LQDRDMVSTTVRHTWQIERALPTLARISGFGNNKSEYIRNLIDVDLKKKLNKAAAYADLIDTMGSNTEHHNQPQSTTATDKDRQ